MMAGQVGNTHAPRCTPWRRCWQPGGCSDDGDDGCDDSDCGGDGGVDTMRWPARWPGKSASHTAAAAAMARHWALLWYYCGVVAEVVVDCGRLQ